MGTSVSQSSPRTSGWRAVGTCYTSERLPESRITLELWRAASSEPELLRQIQSPLVEKCVRLANEETSPQQATQLVAQLQQTNQNSLVGEFAKRTLIAKSAGAFPDESGTSVLFRQLTGYLIARDIAGFVGPEYRCKNVHDVHNLKTKASEIVSKKVGAVEKAATIGRTDWKTLCRQIVEELRQNQ